MTDKAAATAPDGTLEPIAASRDALEQAASELKRSLAEPAATRQWRDAVVAGLERTRAQLDEHLAATRAEDGLGPAVIKAAPRLAGQAARLAREHSELMGRQAAAMALARDPSSTPEDVRDSAAELAALLLRHVHAAHDLLHDALDTEIGGSD